MAILCSERISYFFFFWCDRKVAYIFCVVFRVAEIDFPPVELGGTEGFHFVCIRFRPGASVRVVCYSYYGILAWNLGSQEQRPIERVIEIINTTLTEVCVGK